MKRPRRISKGLATLALRFCDVAGKQRIVLASQGKLTIKSSLQEGTLHIFANVTGGPGNSVH
jgi:hypothetical protein